MHAGAAGPTTAHRRASSDRARRQSSRSASAPGRLMPGREPIGVRGTFRSRRPGPCGRAEPLVRVATAWPSSCPRQPSSSLVLRGRRSSPAPTAARVMPRVKLPSSYVRVCISWVEEDNVRSRSRGWNGLAAGREAGPRAVSCGRLAQVSTRQSARCRLDARRRAAVSRHCPSRLTGGRTGTRCAGVEHGRLRDRPRTAVPLGSPQPPPGDGVVRSGRPVAHSVGRPVPR